MIEINLNSTPVKIGLIALLLFIFLIIIFLWLFVKSKIKQKRSAKLDKDLIIKKWEEIEGMSLGNDASAKLAILEADKLIDGVLKIMSFGGSTMGERLKAACYRYPDLTDVWEAHKIRNLIAHENYQLYPKTAARAINIFYHALKELGIIT
ncbi:MAG: hypothetical protein AAB465_01595 [Patescibacteria group bacterium]